MHKIKLILKSFSVIHNTFTFDITVCVFFLLFIVICDFLFAILFINIILKLVSQSFLLISLAYGDSCIDMRQFASPSGTYSFLGKVRTFKDMSFITFRSTLTIPQECKIPTNRCRWVSFNMCITTIRFFVAVTSVEVKTGW